jgi:hypothetical protein
MPTDPPIARRDPPGRHGQGVMDALIACAVVAIVAAILAGLSWTRPTTSAASIAYTQYGQLAYTAATPPGSVYGGVPIRTGEPVYGSAVSALNVAYTYRLQAADASGVTGTEQLVATFSNGSGLSRSIPLQAAPVRFTGTGFSASATLQLATFESLAAAFAQATGSGYAAAGLPVSISPSVVLHGRIGGQTFNTAFASPIDFTYTAGNFLPSGTAGAQTSFTSTATGAVSVPGGQPATLLGISVVSARIASLAILLAALLLGGLAGWPLLRQATSQDERERISARYGSLIVEVDGVSAHPGVTVVALASFDDVLRVARRLECPILHWGDVGEVYAVVDNATLYRYRAGGSWTRDLLGRPGGTAGVPSSERRPAVDEPSAGSRQQEPRERR